MIKPWPRDIVRKSRIDTIKATKHRVAVSSIGDDARQLFLKYLGIFEETTYYVQTKRMRLGTLIHKLWEEELQLLPILESFETNIPAHPTLPLRGRYDFVLKHPTTGEKYLLELKSTSQEYDEPLYSALSQWSVYAERIGVTQGFIVYDNTATMEERWFGVVRDGNGVVVYSDTGEMIGEWPALVERLYDKVAYVVWCEKNKKRPEPCMSCVLTKCKFPALCQSVEEQYPEQVTFEEWLSGYKE